jgi:hypothetical protein
MPHVSRLAFIALLLASAPVAAQESPPRDGRQAGGATGQPATTDRAADQSGGALDRFLGWLGEQADKPQEERKDWNRGFKPDHDGGRGGGGDGGGGSTH